MKIILILSDKLDFNESGICNPDSFVAIQEKEKEASIIDRTVSEKTKANYRYFASSHPSSSETIQKLFGIQEITIEPLLDEVIFTSTLTNEASYATYMKEAIKNWKKNEKNQKETFNDTKEKCELLIKKLEDLNEDVVLVSHLHKLETLISILKKHGYLIEKPRLFGIKHLDRIRASKKNMHCGGCKHNCLLTNPKCDIGKDKAELRGIEIDKNTNITSRL